MCIIMVKPTKSKFPEDSVFERCWKTNDDGAGFAYRQDGVVKLRKGFMTLEALMSAIKQLPNNVPVIVHFRFATHGLKNHTATHPFPISGDVELLKATSVDGHAAIAHNGVISTPIIGDLSDTQSFIHSHPNVVQSLVIGRVPPEHVELYKKAVGSCRLAILTKDSDTIVRFGDWEKEKYSTGKIFFSNSGYKAWSYPTQRTYRGSSHFNNFTRCWCGSWDYKTDPDFGPLCYKHYTVAKELREKAGVEPKSVNMGCEFCGSPAPFRLEGVRVCYSCLDTMKHSFRGGI